MPPTRPIDGDQLSVVDLESSPATVVQSVTVGPAPAGVAISADGKLVLVVAHRFGRVVLRRRRQALAADRAHRAA